MSACYAADSKDYINFLQYLLYGESLTELGRARSLRIVAMILVLPFVLFFNNYVLAFALVNSVMFALTVWFFYKWLSLHSEKIA
ncbi:MAG: hypothetical protein QXM75_03625, partial [Candidatus Diapherotrites archaeon]